MSAKKLAFYSTQEATDNLMLAWIAMGLTISQIAQNLKRTEKAVEFRWARIKHEKGLRCYADATRYAMVNGLIPFEV